MFVNLAVLKETQGHERRVALVPAVAQRLSKLGAKVHLQAGAGDAVGLPDSAYENVAFVSDRAALVRDADVVLCVQPPALEVVAGMKEGAILLSFVYADHEKRLVRELLERALPWNASLASRERKPWTPSRVNRHSRDTTPCNSAQRT
jgi:NAD(P) transhydrogenase subunit alpha